LGLLVIKPESYGLESSFTAIADAAAGFAATGVLLLVGL
jgi:hypothetical protein